VSRVFVSQVTRFSGGGPWKWIGSTIRWGRQLQQYGYDLAIDPRGDFPSAVILRFCGAPVRLGWGCGGGGFLLTHEAEFVWGRHEVLSRQALLDQLGIAPPADEPAWAPQFEPSMAARQWIDERIGGSGPLIVLHVGAGTTAKRWPVKHWQELIERLAVSHDARIVLVGSAADGESFAGADDWCGQLTIDQLAALIERSDLFIGADSGPAHLAAAIGTPAVVLFSGTNRAEQWRPWGDHVRIVKQPTSCSPCHRTRCPLANHPCMNGLQPRAVLAAAEKLLSKPQRMAV
jgi:ADP-heptose:LPS heptosyltransferase